MKNWTGAFSFYIDFLEGAFLVRNLPPHYANIRKRLVKRPRIYLRDSGLLHALMRVQDSDILYGQPWLEQSWEGFIIEQTIATLNMKNQIATPYYFCCSDGYELDLLLDSGTELCAIEIKLTSNPSKPELNRLNKVAGMIGATKRIMICRTETTFGNNTMTVTSPKKVVGIPIICNFAHHNKQHIAPTNSERKTVNT